MTLLEYLKDKRPGPFKPGYHYFSIDDRIECLWKDGDKPCYAEQVSGEITLIRSMETKEVIGVKIFYVEDKLKEYMEACCEKVRISVDAADPDGGDVSGR